MKTSELREIERIVRYEIARVIRDVASARSEGGLIVVQAG